MTTTINSRSPQASHQIAVAIHADKGWKSNGSLKGSITIYGPSSFGRLPREFHASVADADYVIYSYATPIAWRTQGQWHQPAVKYSVTTSKQQSKVADAIAELLS